MMDMVKTPLKYPGGKSRAIETILDLVPKNFKEYREPFIGGGSVYFAVSQKHTGRKYWINDLNFELYNFWRTCEEDADSVVEKSLELKKKFPNGKELFYHLKRSLSQFNNVELASAYLILNRIAFSGCTLVGGFSDHSFKHGLTDERIKELRTVKKILKGTKITNIDYQKVLEEKSECNDEEVFVFLDPPYYSVTDSGLYGKGGGKWNNLHKTFDHYRFANVIKECKYKYLITYDDSPFIRRLFSFTNVMSWDLAYSMKRHGIGKELFISNYLKELPKDSQLSIEDAWSM